MYKEMRQKKLCCGIKFLRNVVQCAVIVARGRMLELALNGMQGDMSSGLNAFKIQSAVLFIYKQYLICQGAPS